MPQPTVGDVRVNQPLSNYSRGFVQDESKFVWDAFPRMGSPSKSGLYFRYSLSDFYRADMRPRGVATESAGSGYALDTDEYNCKVWALHKDIDDQLLANEQSPLQMERDAVRYLTQQAMISKDKEWAATFFQPAIWSDTVTPAVLWDLPAANPVADVRARMDQIESKTGMRANGMVLGSKVWSAWQDSTAFLDRFEQTQLGILNTQLVAAVLELDWVKVARAVENRAPEGLADDVDYIVDPRSALLLYSPPAPSIMTPAAGLTFTWTNFMGGGNQGMRIKRFRVEELAATRIEIECAYAQKLVSPELGVFFEAAVS